MTSRVTISVTFARQSGVTGHMGASLRPDPYSSMNGAPFSSHVAAAATSPVKSASPVSQSRPFMYGMTRTPCACKSLTPAAKPSFAGK